MPPPGIWADLDISRWVTTSEAHAVSVWGNLTALVLLALIGRAFWVSRKVAGCCDD